MAVVEVIVEIAEINVHSEIVDDEKVKTDDFNEIVYFIEIITTNDENYRDFNEATVDEIDSANLLKVGVPY